MTPRSHVSAVVTALAVVCLTAFATDVAASCVTPNPAGKKTASAWKGASARAVAPSFAPAASSVSDSSDSIAGLWHAVFTIDGQIYDEGFDQWHSDGTEILNDNGVPPVMGNTCLGVWKQIGPRTYKLKHPVWNFDANGTLLGTIVIGEVVTLRRSGQEYRGTFTFDFYDKDGKQTDHVAGDLRATRITVD